VKHHRWLFGLAFLLAVLATVFGFAQRMQRLTCAIFLLLGAIYFRIGDE